MKIGVAQLCSGDTTQENINKIIQIVDSSNIEAPEIIFFPENSIFFRLKTDSIVKPIRLDGEEVAQLKEVCAKNQVAIHFTTAIQDSGLVYNASVLIEKNKKLTLLYKKIHLFDIELQGQKPIRESDVFASGTDSHVFEFGGLTFGSSICYDIRFSELYSIYAKKNVDVILIPAAFLVKTGQAHWEVLCIARAIESQCYVVASAQAGHHASLNHEYSRETFGHSMVVDPWGVVLHVKPEGTGVFFIHLNKEEITKVRTQIPMSHHRRNIF